jgi:hypothetical protein
MQILRKLIIKVPILIINPPCFALLFHVCIAVLVPFTIYATYHVSNYLRTNLFNQLWIRQRVSEETRRAWTAKLVQFEQTQPNILYNASMLEILTFPILITGLLLYVLDCI